MTCTEHTRRLGAALAVALVVAPWSGDVQAQGLAARVRAVSGEAEIRFAARPGVCGDGERMVSFHSPARAAADREDGWWQRCEPGPVRVRFTVHGGTVRVVPARPGGGPAQMA